MEPRKKGSFLLKVPIIWVSTWITLRFSSSSDEHLRHWWKLFWMIPVPPKTKICCWKSYDDILPTKINLLKKSTTTDLFCIFCRNREEIIQHVLWECKISKKIWGHSFGPDIESVFLNKINWTDKDYWEWILKGTSADERCKIMIITWQIWEARNRVIFRSDTSEIKEIQHKIYIHIQQNSRNRIFQPSNENTRRVNNQGRQEILSTNLVAIVGNLIDAHEGLRILLQQTAGN